VKTLSPHLIGIIVSIKHWGKANKVVDILRPVLEDASSAASDNPAITSDAQSILQPLTRSASQAGLGSDEFLPNKVSRDLGLPLHQGVGMPVSKARKGSTQQAIERDQRFYSRLVDSLKARQIPAPELLASIIISQGISEACGRLNQAVVLAWHEAVDAVGNHQRVDAKAAFYDRLPRGLALRSPARSERLEALAVGKP